MQSKSGRWRELCKLCYSSSVFIARTLPVLKITGRAPALFQSPTLLESGQDFWGTISAFSHWGKFPRSKLFSWKPASHPRDTVLEAPTYLPFLSPKGTAVSQPRICVGEILLWTKVKAPYSRVNSNRIRTHPVLCERSVNKIRKSM